MFGVLIGGGCLLMALLSSINTAVDGNWVLSVSGADVELPNNYEACAGIAAVGVLLIGLSFFGSFVRHHYQAAQGNTPLRVGIIVAALMLLFAAGRGLQVLVLTQTYGSMLAYYATDGDLDDVRDELAKGPSHEDLDAAVSRAAQYDNAEALALLLDAGADLRDETSPAKFRRCALAGTGIAFVRIALDHGVTPDTCPKSEALIWQVVNEPHDDATTAELVRMLAAAGWSTTAVPEHGGERPLELAKQRQKPLTAAQLQGGA